MTIKRAKYNKTKERLDRAVRFAIIKMFKHAALSVRRDRGFCFLCKIK